MDYYLVSFYRYIVLGIVGLLFALNPIAAQSVELSKPPPPTLDVPEINERFSTIICVDCDQPFGFDGHEELNAEILKESLYVAELRKAMYWQDIVHQFESKAHFDNCDFDNAIAYIDELLEQVREYAAEALKAQENDNTTKMENFARKAFFSIGQILHVVQDFYAHSNYIEIKVKNTSNINELPVIHPWTVEGKKIISDLQKEGLVSGFVFWGFPQECPDGTLSHSELAKDSELTKSGQIKLSHLENLSQYRIALNLARKASTDLILFAMNNWPILKSINGPYVAFDTLVDRRGL